MIYLQIMAWLQGWDLQEEKIFEECGVVDLVTSWRVGAHGLSAPSDLFFSPQNEEQNLEITDELFSVDVIASQLDSGNDYLQIWV
jgi:hypothetical protein